MISQLLNVNRHIIEIYIWKEDWFCFSSYLDSSLKGVPHKWQPAVIRSSATLQSECTYSLLLMNMLSTSDSGRCLQVIGRNNSPTDAYMVALQESGRSDKYLREMQSWDFVSSCTFQLIDTCFHCKSVRPTFIIICHKVSQLTNTLLTGVIWQQTWSKTRVCSFHYHMDTNQSWNTIFENQ